MAEPERHSVSKPLLGFSASFFPPGLLCLVSSEAAYFQTREQMLKHIAPRHGAAVLMMPRLYTYTSFETMLGKDVYPAEIENLQRDFILNKLSSHLPPAIGLKIDDEAASQRVIQELASDLGDGFDRLKLAAIGWDTIDKIEPAAFSKTIASLGDEYDNILARLNLSDRFSRRRKILDMLNQGYHFDVLKGVSKIVCRAAERFSPFESALIASLMQHYQVEVAFNVPAWVRNEDLFHQSGFDVMRAIREIEKSANSGPDALLEFSDAPVTKEAALAYAAENLLAPPSYNSQPPPAAEAIKILGVPSPYHEVEETARRLKDIGCGPQARALHNFAVLVPDLNKYDELIKDVGRRFGIPFHLQRGEALMEQMPVRGALDLLDLWESHWEISAVMRLLSSPYFQFNIDPVQLRLLALECGVTDDRAGGGFELNLAKSKSRYARQLLEIIKKLKSQGRLMKNLSSWHELLNGFRRILNGLGWPGHFSDSSYASPDIREKEIKAAFALKDELKQLEAALEIEHAPQASLANFRFWLRHSLKRRYLNSDINPHGRVWVLNYYDLNGAQFDEIFCLGLNEGVFPQTAPDRRWWPDDFIRALSGTALGRSLWSSSADRYRQEEGMLASALGQALKKAWLIYSTSDATNRSLLASPLLESLKELWKESPPEQQPCEEKRGWPNPVSLSCVRAYDELGPSLMHVPPEQWPENVPNEMRLYKEKLQKRFEQWQQQKDSVGTGHAAMNLWLKHIDSYGGEALLSPSFFRSFYDCPLACWFSEILLLRFDAEELEEWSSLDEGTLVHEIMEKFFRPVLGSLWPDRTRSKDELQQLLLGIINDSCDHCENNNPLGREPLWPQRRKHLTETVLRWLDRELLLEEQTCPIALEWKFDARPDAHAEPLKIESAGGAFYVKGRIDRVDEFIRDGHKRIIVRDYKLRPSGFYKFNKRGGKIPSSLFPLHIYALAAASHFAVEADCILEFLNPSGGAPLTAGYSSGEKAMTLDSEIRKEMSADNTFNLANHLSDIFQAVRRGSFSNIWNDEEANCEYCQYTLICPKSGSGQGGNI